jgi:hypothetical protein
VLPMPIFTHRPRTRVMPSSDSPTFVLSTTALRNGVHGTNAGPCRPYNVHAETFTICRNPCSQPCPQVQHYYSSSALLTRVLMLRYLSSGSAPTSGDSRWMVSISCRLLAVYGYAMHQLRPLVDDLSSAAILDHGQNEVELKYWQLWGRIRLHLRLPPSFG